MQIPSKAQETIQKRRRRRRGATMMEYLVVISVILVVLIIVVQQLGFTTRSLFTHNGEATKADYSGPATP
jgi:Flp pilus assembly pilin Flp